jgi:hypothetical protein
MISRVTLLGSVTVKKLTLHLPVTEIELSLCSATQTLPISAPPA